MDADDLAAFRNTRRRRRSAWGPNDPVYRKVAAPIPSSNHIFLAAGLSYERLEVAGGAHWQGADSHR